MIFEKGSEQAQQLKNRQFERCGCPDSADIAHFDIIATAQAETEAGLYDEDSPGDKRNFAPALDAA